MTRQEAKTLAVKLPETINTFRLPSLVVLGTLGLGIVPLSILAALSGTLWSSLKCDVPLLAVPSVWLGDLVFLPLVNVRILRFFMYLKSRPAGLPSAFWLVGAGFFALSSSTVVMGYLHYLWTQDAYVGFIDPVPGHLGLAGWWHLGFSIVESAGIVVFLGLWLRSRRLPGAEAFRHGFTVWVPFLAYSALSVLDFVVSHRLILPRHPEVVSAWWTNWEALMILPFSLSVYVIGNILSAHDGSRLTRRDKKPEVPRGMEAHAGVVMPHGLKTKLTDRPITKREELLLNLHIAEYSALMARATNWLTLESGIWLLMVGFVAILPNLWNSLPQHLIVWGSFGVLLIMLFVWSNMTYDHYTSVRYIEHELRSSIIGVIGPARFWRYEAFIAPTRPKNQPFWFEAAPAFGSFGVLAALAAYRFPRRQPWDYIEFGIDLLLWCFYLWFTLRMVKVRQDLYKIETDLGPEDTNPGSGKEAQKP